MSITRRSSAITIAATAALAVLLAGCSGDSDDGGTGGGEGTDGEYNDIVFWTPQVTPSRLAAQEQIAADFEAETGIGVEVVPLGGADQNQALVTGAASGDVPDVILHGADQTAAWVAQGLLDTEVTAAAMEALDPSTFNENALNQVTLDGEVASVPSDGWVHLIVYRQDLFDAAGVEVPTNLAELAEAATALSETGVTGIALGTQSGTPSSTEAVNSILPTNGCELVVSGEVTIDSPECVEGLEHFLELRDSSVSGDLDVPAAQAAYLAGDAAMLLFSTHIFDELAGLSPDVPVTCAECVDNPNFLAENSGFITVLDEANPNQFGTVLGYGVPVGANSTEAQMFIEYVMSTGYVDTLATATEGRLPLRLGTPENPSEFIDAWGALPIGPAPEEGVSIASIYGEEIVTDINAGMESVYRWGFGTEDAELAGAAFTQGTLASNLDALYGGTPAADVAATMAEQVTALQAELG
ncbi:ABC transporter substrate-binding protein [Occultella kanbiaonis]|uniref:ABC transporter substrate-binding protein n=1 Tax=Occultella kanbiaonis TaxID=2675754 RepID=UPI0013D75DCE|nr:extracellular solute-binding protein [Occultella kanbiaonis]